MILAAGRGTRLLPITEQTPKALVEVDGVPMLEHVARRLIDAGATRLIVNVHHLGQQVRDFLEHAGGFGAEVCVSDEEGELLDTGGGVLHAEECFSRDAPFLLHNVDVVSDIDLADMYRTHCSSTAIATLAVMSRDSTRHLIFDQHGLCGHGNSSSGTERLARTPTGDVQRLGFCGIHVISERIFDRITETGVFSIIDVYMRLVSEGERIAPYVADGRSWMDIGTHEQLQKANLGGFA